MSDVSAILSELSDLPRDGVVVTAFRDVARLVEARGRRALLLGRDFRNERDLRDKWSDLTRRVGIAHVIGSQSLCDAVTHFCNITHINRETSVRRCRRWGEHYIINLILLSEVPHAMQIDAAKGRPAIIVGAGPSLAKNAYLLHGEAHTTNALIIGVNAGSLAVPCDITLSVESNDIHQKLSTRGMQVLSLASPPSLLTQRKERLRLIWNGEIAWIAEEITDIARLPTSGGGTSSAISLAHLWGCDPIVLVGQDLAYTDGKVYADATGFGRDTIERDGSFTWADSVKLHRPGNPLPDMDELEDVPAWGGGTVRSGIPFRALRHWLAACAETFEDTTCVNATEGGSSIPGWKEETLKNVLRSFSHSHMGSGWLELGEPTISREAIVDWLRTKAADELAEVWAFGPIHDRVQQHRAQAPKRIPLLEAYAVRAVMRDTEALIAGAKREIHSLVEEVCSISGAMR